MGVSSAEPGVPLVELGMLLPGSRVLVVVAFVAIATATVVITGAGVTENTSTVAPFASA